MKRAESTSVFTCQPLPFLSVRCCVILFGELADNQKKKNGKSTSLFFQRHSQVWVQAEEPTSVETSFRFPRTSSADPSRIGPWPWTCTWNVTLLRTSALTDNSKAAMTRRSSYLFPPFSWSPEPQYFGTPKYFSFRDFIQAPTETKSGTALRQYMFINIENK